MESIRRHVTIETIMVNSELLRDIATRHMHNGEQIAADLKCIVEDLHTKQYDLIDPAAIKGVGD